MLFFGRGSMTGWCTVSRGSKIRGLSIEMFYAYMKKRFFPWEPKWGLDWWAMTHNTHPPAQSQSCSQPTNIACFSLLTLTFLPERLFPLFLPSLHAIQMWIKGLTMPISSVKPPLPTPDTTDSTQSLLALNCVGCRKYSSTQGVLVLGQRSCIPGWGGGESLQGS